MSWPSDLAFRWYLRRQISYRDLELMPGDRGAEVDHATIFRWVGDRHNVSCRGDP
jgi:transposase-like protein